MYTLLDPLFLREVFAGVAGWQFGLPHFSVGATLLLVLSLAGIVFSSYGLLRVGRREDRQERLEDVQHAAAEDDEDRPPPVPWYSRLSATLLRSPIVALADPQRVGAALVEAGISGDSTYVGAFLASKVVAALAVAALWQWLGAPWGFLEGVPYFRWGIIVFPLLVGSYVPDAVLSRIAAPRKLRLEYGLPDALDLLVICAESGLALQQSVEAVSNALRHADTDI